MALLTGTTTVRDGSQALGLVAGVEWLQLIDSGSTLTMAVTEPLAWTRGSQRFWCLVALQGLAADERIALVQFDHRHLRERHRCDVIGANQNRGDGGGIGSQAIGRPHRNVESARAADQCRDRLTADSGLPDWIAQGLGAVNCRF